MALVLTIAGVTKQIKHNSLHISQTANGRTTASFLVVSLDGTYRPALDAEVLLVEDGTRIFGGLLERPRERGAADGSSVSITTAINAVDFHAYTERRYVNQTIPTGTLAAALTILTTYLSTYGVTLDAGQVTGPTLPELVYEYRPLTEVLNEIATLTADFGEPFVWRINEFKVLRMYQPSTTAAPFNLIGEAIQTVVGDIEVESTRENFANRIIVRSPSRTEMSRTETFTGNGTQTVFPLQYTLFQSRGYVTSAGVFETLGGPGDIATWIYDPATNTITRNAAPANGAVISINFDGTFTGLGIAEDAASIAALGLWERVAAAASSVSPPI